MATLDDVVHIADIALALEVELDRRIMTVTEILGLRKGSLIRLTRSAGENIDIRIGAVVLGYGEIVVIEDRMGVRITDLASEE
jgi:flagellar motor switch protein FliN